MCFLKPPGNRYPHPHVLKARSGANEDQRMAFLFSAVKKLVERGCKKVMDSVQQGRRLWKGNLL